MHSGPIGKSPESMTRHQDKGQDHVSSGPGKGEWNNSLSPEGKGETVSPSVTIQVQPAVPEQVFTMGDGTPSIQMNLLL